MLKVRLTAMIKISDRIAAYVSCLAYAGKNMAGFFIQPVTIDVDSPPKK